MSIHPVRLSLIFLAKVNYNHAKNLMLTLSSDPR